MLWGLACFVFSFVLKISVVGVVGPFLFNSFCSIVLRSVVVGSVFNLLF